MHAVPPKTAGRRFDRNLSRYALCRIGKSAHAEINEILYRSSHDAGNFIGVNRKLFKETISVAQKSFFSIPFKRCKTSVIGCLTLFTEKTCRKLVAAQMIREAITTLSPPRARIRAGAFHGFVMLTAHFSLPPVGKAMECIDPVPLALKGRNRFFSRERFSVSRPHSSGKSRPEDTISRCGCNRSHSLFCF